MIQLKKWHVYLIFAALFAALLALPQIAWAQVTGCDALGMGWFPQWVNGVPDCTYMGTFENGCCYRADGLDSTAVFGVSFAAVGLICLFLFAGLYKYAVSKWFENNFGGGY